MEVESIEVTVESLAQLSLVILQLRQRVADLETGIRRYCDEVMTIEHLGQKVNVSGSMISDLVDLLDGDS